MKSTFYTAFVYATMCFVVAGCAASRQSATAYNILKAAKLQPQGRYYITPDSNLALVGSAAHAGFSFRGPECRVYTALPNAKQHSYLQYTVDGVYGGRVRIEGSNSEPLVIHATGTGTHEVQLYKTTEAHSGALIIKQIVAANIKPLPVTKAPLIEFIGNSITCGAAADASQVPCGTGEYHDQHNAYMAYGPTLARALNTNFILSCVSGIGVYRNWNSDGPTMPQVYDYTDLVPGGTITWGTDKPAPDIVSIALGTNDFSNGDGKRPRLPFDSTAFVSNYARFVSHLKTLYPRAKFVLLSSPMLQGANRQLLYNCLVAVKQKVDAGSANSQPTDIYNLSAMQPHGCSGHPDVNDHQQIASELIPIFEKLL